MRLARLYEAPRVNVTVHKKAKKKSSLTSYAAGARDRLLSFEPPSLGEYRRALKLEDALLEWAVKEAADIQDLEELSEKQPEFEEVVEEAFTALHIILDQIEARVIAETEEMLEGLTRSDERFLEALEMDWPDPDELSSSWTLNFSSMHNKQLKEYVTSRGGSLVGVAERSELIAACIGAMNIKELKGYAASCGGRGSLVGVTDKSELVALCKELQVDEPPPNPAPRGPGRPVRSDAPPLEMALIDARLACLDVLEAKKSDPIALTVGLLKVKELDLDKEECGQALLEHTLGLCKRAEDVVEQPRALLSDLEDATELFEAVRHEPRMSQQRPLKRANDRLQEVRREQKQIGLRTKCGPFVKILSIQRETPLDETTQKIATCWARSVEAFPLSWRSENGGTHPLHTEEQWQECLHANPMGPIDIVLDKTKMATEMKKKRKKPARKAEAAREEAKKQKKEVRAKTTLAPLAKSGAPKAKSPGKKT